jgi:hypothetical protein
MKSFLFHAKTAKVVTNYAMTIPGLTLCLLGFLSLLTLREFKNGVLYMHSGKKELHEPSFLV